MRKLTEKTLVIATHNAGKLSEIQELVVPYGIEAVSAGALGLPEPIENGLTFIENAIIKAKAAAHASNLPALADDSGLAVEALNGAPGIYSARWAGETKDFNAAMQRVEHELKIANTNRNGAFVCALCLAWPDGHVETFEGRVDGKMIWPPRGGQGFGYDPIFQPSGYDKTFAEMTSVEKHGRISASEAGLSHRSRAFFLLEQACLK